MVGVLKTLPLFLLAFVLIANGQQTGTLEGNDELTRAINAAIVRLDQNGTIETLLAKWFRNTYSSSRTCTNNPTFYPYPIQPRVGGTLDVVLGRKELRIGSTLATSPFASINVTTPIGFEVDLISAILGELSKQYGFTINARWINIPWKQFKDELYKGTVDILANGIELIGESDNQLNSNIFQFPCSVFVDQPAVLKGNLTTGLNYPNLASLNTATTKIAVLNNTLSAIIARQKYPLAQIFEYATNTDALGTVLGFANGTLPINHFYITSNAVVTSEAARVGASVSNFGVLASASPVGFAVRKDSFTIASLIPCGSLPCGGPICQ